MINTTIDRSKGEMILKYPVLCHKKDEVVKFYSNQQAFNIWSIRQRVFIKDVLAKFMKQRQYALANHMSSRQDIALRRIDFVLRNYYEKDSLKLLVKKVIMLESDILEIAPSPRSRFYEHYVTVIVCLFNWCKWYSKQF
ncbi:MAG TPA: hypothetical protein DCW66_17745 [Sphingobacterium sp.]|nr:hypothetical protein [Sphingobacterium sp.]HAU54996.1 hypothetical protein [Sphingobacterium sp.]